MFVERALTYVLGYLLQAGGGGGGKKRPLKDVWRDAWDEGQTLAIKLRADNDFYSQTSQVRRIVRSRSGNYAHAKKSSEALFEVHGDEDPNESGEVRSAPGLAGIQQCIVAHALLQHPPDTLPHVQQQGSPHFYLACTTLSLCS